MGWHVKSLTLSGTRSKYLGWALALRARAPLAGRSARRGCRRLGRLACLRDFAPRLPARGSQPAP